MSQQQAPSEMPDPTPIARQSTQLSRKAIAFVVLAPLILVGVSFLARISWRRLDRSVIQLFDVMAEQNIPSWYSTMLYMASASLAWLTILMMKSDGERADLRVWSWRMLSLLFLVMSIDELVSIHERAGRWIRPLIAPQIRESAGDSMDWLLATAWILPGIAAVLVILSGLAVWHRHAPVIVRRRVVTGFLVLVAGGLGMELVGSLVYEHSIPLLVAGHVEELLELMGASLIAVGVASYFQIKKGAGSLTVSPDAG